MLIAKSEYAMTHLAKQFYDHTIQRHYLALVWGCPTPQAGTLSSTLGRHEKDRKRMQVYSDNTKGKWAVTHYNVLEDLYYVSLIKCTLETGRTHQIRVHLSHLGHALFNDERYGGHHILKGTVFSEYKQFVDKVFQTLPRQALHAQTLGFEHPVSKERLHFTSPLPEDFSSALELWKQYYHDKIENA